MRTLCSEFVFIFMANKLFLPLSLGLEEVGQRDARSVGHFDGRGDTRSGIDGLPLFVDFVDPGLIVVNIEHPINEIALFSYTIRRCNILADKYRFELFLILWLVEVGVAQERFYGVNLEFPVHDFGIHMDMVFYMLIFLAIFCINLLK